MREYLAALMPWGDALVLELLRYPQDLRDANDLDLTNGAIADRRNRKEGTRNGRFLLPAMGTEGRLRDDQGQTPG